MEREMRHAVYGQKELYSDPKVPALVSAAYGVLSQAACDKLPLESEGFRKAWGEIVSEANGQNAVFSLIDQLECRLLRSRAVGRFIYRHSPQLMRRWMARFS